MRAKLEQIRGDVAAGRLSLARARAEGVLSSGKATAEAILLAGDISRALGDEVRAGARYWVVADESEEREACLRAFKHATRGGGELRVAMAQVATKFQHLAPRFGEHWKRDAGPKALEAAIARVRRRSEKRRKLAAGATPTAPPRLPLGCFLGAIVGAILATVGGLAIVSFVYEALTR